MKQIVFDRAGFQYSIVNSVEEANKQGINSYVTFNEDGTPVVIREGNPVLSSFFSDGNGHWAKIINSVNPDKVAKVLKKAENPAIALKDGQIVCQFIALTGIIWHDDKGRKFFLVSRYEREEMEADHLAYLTAESEGTYETLKYIAHDGSDFIPVPRYLYNEKNKKFTVGVNFKAMGYAEMRRRGNASIAIKNCFRPVFARKSVTGEYILAHTFGAYEAQEVAKGGGAMIVDYVEGGNGGWEVSAEEFPKRYQFYSVSEEGRAMFIPTAARYVWVHLFGDFIGCIPQWGDSMVAMSNPQINITNPDDVYACSYIEFYGKENIPGGYVVVEELFLGAPEWFINGFAETLKGFISTEFGIPKQDISDDHLQELLKEHLGIPEVAGIQQKVAAAVAA